MGFENLLTVPQRITDIAPIKEKLTLLIQQDFFQPASQFQADLDTAQQLQTSIATASRNSPSDASISNLFNYYYMIQDVRSKFPDQGVLLDWYSTLGHNPKHCQITSWTQESAQIVFQIGSVYSSLAAQQSGVTDEGIRNACNHLKLAAGCFQHALQYNVSLPDFDVATLLTLRLLALAQAQEVTWLKAITNPSMKNTVVARLAAKVAELYEEARTQGQTSPLITQDWLNTIKVKECHFTAVAHYRMSIVALDLLDHGGQVAHLRVALSQCKEASKYKRYVSAAVLEDHDGLSNVVSSALAGAEKDNNLIYLKPVPEKLDLNTIEGVLMVKSQLPPELEARPEDMKVAFSTLIPFTIVQASQAFQERQDAYVSDVVKEPLQAMDRIFSKFLADLNLPASIDAIQKPEELPDSILAHSREILAMGGPEIIEHSMNETQKLAETCKNLVLGCLNILDMDKHEDDLLRKREGEARWTRPDSDTAFSNYRSRIGVMQSYLEQGKLSDQILRQGFENIKPVLEMYCAGKDQLSRLIPKAESASLDPEVGKAVATLRALLNDASEMESARRDLIGRVETKARNSRLLQLVLESYKKDTEKYHDLDGKLDARKLEPIYEAHLENFEEDLEQVETHKKHQIELERTVLAANRHFIEVHTSSLSQIQKNRQDTLQHFEETYVQFLELISNLNQASRFYSDYIEKGTTFLRELEGFLYQRREEARELSMAIHREDRDFEPPKTPLFHPTGRKGNAWDHSKGIKFS